MISVFTANMILVNLILLGESRGLRKRSKLSAEASLRYMKAFTSTNLNAGKLHRLEEEWHKTSREVENSLLYIVVDRMMKFFRGNSRA